MTEASTVCFHCNLPLTEPAPFSLLIDKQQQPLCCLGCKSVCEAIHHYGLDNYYQYRTEAATRPVKENASVVPVTVTQKLPSDALGLNRTSR